MERHTYRVDLGYDGSGFRGFQKQREARTVESTLLAALCPLVPELPKVSCGGRTDRGVHASGQVVSFYSRRALAEGSIAAAIAAAAPGEIEVCAVREVERHFHASFSAVARRYRYRARDPDVDVEALQRMLDPLLGERCFSAFARDTRPGVSMRCRLSQARVQREGDAVVFDFAASRFLRRQVRVMVATALALSGSDDPDALVKLCSEAARGATARPADPGGLCLVAVEYPGDDTASTAPEAHRLRA